MSLKFKKSFILFVILISTGCGTVLHGKKQYIPLESNPTGATINVGGYKLQTPSTAILDRNLDYLAKVNKEGFREKEITIAKHLDPLSILGGILTGGIGIAVDYYTDSLYLLSPERITVTLEKKPEKKMYELVD